MDNKGGRFSFPITIDTNTVPHVVGFDGAGCRAASLIPEGNHKLTFDFTVGGSLILGMVEEAFAAPYKDKICEQVGLLITDLAGPLAGNVSQFFVKASEFEGDTLADEKAWLGSVAGSSKTDVIEFAPDSLVDMLGDVFSSIALVKDDNDQVYLNQVVKGCKYLKCARSSHETIN
jgi:hypothetical protein